MQYGRPTILILCFFIKKMFLIKLDQTFGQFWFHSCFKYKYRKYKNKISLQFACNKTMLRIRQDIIADHMFQSSMATAWVLDQKN